MGEGLIGKRVAMFSYGSGSVASLYSFVGRSPVSAATATTATTGMFSLSRIQAVTDVFERLAKRTRCPVDEFSAALDMRARKYGQAPMVPDGSLDHIASGTYYLVSINEKHHRLYDRK